jgi:type I restriction enzyme, R subunit
VDVDAIFAAEKLARLALISQAVEALVSPDDRRRGFFRVAGAAICAYKALLPDERAAPYLKTIATLHVLDEVVRGKLGPVDISAVSAKIEALLDKNIEGVAITAPIIEGDETAGRVDLSAIDFEKLAKLFAARPRTAAEKLRSEAEVKAREMAERNPTRIHLVEKLEKLVEEYNLGTLGVEAFFEALKALIAAMEEEERRAAREGLTEDELAVFDLLTKPKPTLSKPQEVAVKKVARNLLEKLQEHLAAADWRAKQQTRAAVQSTIRFTLNDLPEESYPEPLWNDKVDAVWAFVFARRMAAEKVGASRAAWQ